jgi:hypothetical protein
MVSVKGSPVSALVNRARFQPVADISALPPRADFFNRNRKIIGLTFKSLLPLECPGEPRYAIVRKVAKTSIAASPVHMRPLVKRRGDAIVPKGGSS